MRTRFRVRRSIPSVCLVSALLVTACGGPAPTPTSAPSFSPTPSGPLAPATPTAAPTPSPTAASAGLSPGSLAVTVSDRLRVRSQPRVADDSVRYEPLLPTGTQLVIAGGPVKASGYTWYRVVPLGVTLRGGVDEGWVAIADHDGTPWVALADDPTPGFRLASVQVARPQPTAADAKRAAESINAFGLELYRAILRDPNAELEGKGVVFSPTSVAIALAMARAGARGTTAEQMDAVLRSAGWDAMGRQLGALEQLLASRDAAWTDDGGSTHALSLRIANAAFGQDGWPIEQAYLDRIGRAMGAGLGLVDYVRDAEGARQAINGFVARETANRIPELLGPRDVSGDTRLVLVNAIYLKAKWVREFGEWYTDATKPRPFTTAVGTSVQVPTMALRGEQDVPYASGAGWKATELRYLGADGTTPLAMTLILPHDPAAFENGLTPTKLDTITAKLDRQRASLQKLTYTPEDWADMRCGTYAYSLHLFMPKFGIDTRADLGTILRAMGMEAATTAGEADFSGITDPSSMFIAKVVHQANIDVDENGTEAAAATAVVGETTGGCGGPSPAKTITLRLNRPFLFVLRDVQTGAILFMGRVMDPSVRG